MSDDSVDSNSIWTNFSQYIADIRNRTGDEAYISSYTDDSHPSSVSTFSDPEENTGSNIAIAIQDTSSRDNEIDTEDIDYGNIINMTSNNSKWLDGTKPRDTARKKDEVMGLGISVTKEEREKLKSQDKKTYYKVRETCTKGIPNKFTQLKAIDENSPI